MRSTPHQNTRMSRTGSPDLSGRLIRVVGANRGAHSHFFLNAIWVATMRVFSMYSVYGLDALQLVNSRLAQYP